MPDDRIRGLIEKLGPIFFYAAILEETLEILIMHIRPSFDYGVLKNYTMGSKIDQLFKFLKEGPVFADTNKSTQLRNELKKCKKLCEKRNIFVHGAYAQIDKRLFLTTPKQGPHGWVAASPDKVFPPNTLPELTEEICTTFAQKLEHVANRIALFCLEPTK